MEPSYKEKVLNSEGDIGVRKEKVKVKRKGV